MLTERYTPEARDLLGEWQQQRTAVFAPWLLPFEVTNVIYDRVRQNLVTSDYAPQLLTTLFGLLTTFDDDVSLQVRAIEIALDIGQTTSYDAHYAALAEREACDCWTADRRFWQAATERYPFVRYVGNP